MNQKYQLESVTLNVHNLQAMTTFYTDVIGLSVHHQDDQQSKLGGRNGKTILVLNKVETNTRKQSTGLYHHAILLDSREALGTFLKHLVKKQYPIDGASDHGYSEAIYLTDPEGNGIEVYRDKPTSEWMVKDDGSIEGYTIAMDTQGVLNAGKETFEGLNAQTVMGHVHLFVNNLTDTQTFYVDGLGFELKFDFGQQAKFFASGFYHHHLGTNTWAGTNLPKPQHNELGLAYYTLTTTEDLNELALKLKDFSNSVTLENGILKVLDNSGIEIRIEK